MVSVALVDFGNTLVDETFLRQDGDRFPTWTADLLAVLDEAGDGWDTGLVSTAELAGRIAARLGAGADEVHDHMLELCWSMTFFPAINAAVRRRRDRGGRQALVTVNPDLFADIAAHFALHDAFDLVVTSAEEGTVDKIELCQRALERLGGVPAADSVLVDNIAPHVDGWVAAGGHGYLFHDDTTFASDVAAGRVPGFLPDDG